MRKGRERRRDGEEEVGGREGERERKREREREERERERAKKRDVD